MFTVSLYYCGEAAHCLISPTLSHLNIWPKGFQARDGPSVPQRSQKPRRMCLWCLCQSSVTLLRIVFSREGACWVLGSTISEYVVLRRQTGCGRGDPCIRLVQGTPAFSVSLNNVLHLQGPFLSLLQETFVLYIILMFWSLPPSTHEQNLPGLMLFS